MQADSQVYLDDLFDKSQFDEVLSLLPPLDLVARKSVAPGYEKEKILAYSGGIDSSICSELFFPQGSQKSDSNFLRLLSLGTSDSRDVLEQKKREKDAKLKNPVTLRIIERDRIESAAKRVSEIVSVETISHFEDCVAFFLIGEEAQKLGGDIIVSANGPDELFCGYDRFRRILDNEGYASVEKEIENSLAVAEKLRNNVKIVIETFGMKTEEPFLKRNFIDYALKKIPAYLKIQLSDDMLRKRIWRAYGRSLGLAQEIVLKEKKAMQYSMGIHKVILPMVKNNTIRLEKKEKVCR